MGCPLRTRTLVIAQGHVTQAVENAHRWLAIVSTNVIGTPVVCGMLHSWVAAFHDVLDNRLIPNISLPAVAKEVDT
eukprot:1073698-Lingulodinium_polyedra.AAC.1